MLRLITRTSTAATGVCVLAASWLTFFAPSASAASYDPIVLRDGESVTVEYPAIPVADGGTTPEGCADSSNCDVIPLEILVDPGRDIDEDPYFVEVKLSWETDQVPRTPALNPVSYHDLDMYVYTDPNTPEEVEARGGTTERSDGRVASGATGDQPEFAYLSEPAGKYSIVVSNFVAGPDRDYTLQVTWFNDSVPTPFESLAPEFTPPATTTTTSSTTSTTTTTAAPTTTIAPPPTIAQADIDAGEAFDLDQFDNDDFDDALAAPTVIPLEPVASGPLPEPSDMALIFWLLAVPLGIVALSGTLILRGRAVL